MAMCRNCCNLSPRRSPSDGMAASERPADGHVLARPRFWQISPLKQPSKRSRPDHFQLRPAYNSMKNKYITTCLYLLISSMSFYIFSQIGNIYYFHSNSKVIITTGDDLTLEKTIFWPHNRKSESTYNNYIASRHTDYFELTGQYYTANLIYILFVTSIFFLFKILFLLFENHFIRCQNASPAKHFTTFLLAAFFIYNFTDHLHIGDIFDSGSIIHVKFNTPVLIKGFVYTYNTDNYDYNENDDTIKKYAAETGDSSPDDGVSTQTIFDIIVIFSIYYILRCFYITKHLYSTWRSHRTNRAFSV